MAAKNEKSGARRASKNLGNCGNENVDRSQETAMTRRQQRQKHRENMRHQAEVAPYLGLSDSEDDKVETETKKENKEETTDPKESESKKNFPLHDLSPRNVTLDRGLSFYYLSATFDCWTSPTNTPAPLAQIFSTFCLFTNYLSYPRVPILRVS
ncbi:hypothetical protein NW752_004348 [Fusarium irregulare]|nr:hypothetical protein NW752_004348 [Fusarium irregulare]